MTSPKSSTSGSPVGSNNVSAASIVSSTSSTDGPMTQSVKKKPQKKEHSKRRVQVAASSSDSEGIKEEKKEAKAKRRPLVTLPHSSSSMFARSVFVPKGENSEDVEEYQIDQNELDDQIKRVCRTETDLRDTRTAVGKDDLSKEMTRAIDSVAKKMKKKPRPVDHDIDDMSTRSESGENEHSIDIPAEDDTKLRFQAAVRSVMTRIQELQQPQQHITGHSEEDEYDYTASGSDTQEMWSFSAPVPTMQGLTRVSYTQPATELIAPQDPVNPQSLKLMEQMLKAVEGRTSPAPQGGLAQPPPPSQGEQALSILGTMQSLFAKYLPNNGKWTFGLAILTFAIFYIIDAIIRASSETILDSLEEDVTWTPIVLALVAALLGLSIDYCSQRKKNKKQENMDEDPHIARLAMVGLQQQYEARFREVLDQEQGSAILV